jgi:hypothetical protein
LWWSASTRFRGYVYTQHALEKQRFSIIAMFERGWMQIIKVEKSKLRYAALHQYQWLGKIALLCLISVASPGKNCQLRMVSEPPIGGVIRYTHGYYTQINK